MTIETKQPSYVTSPIMGVAALIGLVVAINTPNPVETTWTVLLLYFITRVFWWQHYPGILLLVLFIPFAEVHTAILEANNFGISIEELYPVLGGKRTFWLASFGMLMVALGLRLGLIPIWSKLSLPWHQLKTSAENINANKLLTAAVLVSILGLFLRSLIGYESSFRQILTYYSGISNALYVTFALHFWIVRRRAWLFIFVFLLIILNSFYSYFSDWTIPFLILGISYLIGIKHFRTKQLGTTLPIILPGLLLIFIWQSVKMEYRAFLSGGRKTQAVVVSRDEALNKFSDLANEAVQEERLFDDAVVQDTYRRAGYLEYFNAATHKVPEEISYRKGALFMESANFALVPRVLNPNKGIKDDKAKVELYTDYYFGENSFASFSLGHYCEAYIDWGPNGMMIHLFIYGLFGAVLMRITAIRTRNLNPLLSYGILWSIMFPWGTSQSDMVTVLGTTVWGALSHLVIFLPAYRWLDSYIHFGKTLSLNENKGA